MSTLVVADHPLIAHKLSLMRDKAAPSAQFRHLLRALDVVSIQQYAAGLDRLQQAAGHQVELRSRQAYD